MAQSCMDLFETKKLSDTGMVEQVRSPSLFWFLAVDFRLKRTSRLPRFLRLQNCATGVTPEGKTPKSLVDDMVPLLGNNEAVVTFVQCSFLSCLRSRRLDADPIALSKISAAESTRSELSLSTSSTRTECQTRIDDVSSSTRSCLSRSRML